MRLRAGGFDGASDHGEDSGQGRARGLVDV